MSWLRHQHTIFLIATGVCLGVVAGAMWPIAPVAYVVLALVGCGIAAVMRYRPTTRVVGRWLLLILVVGSLALWRTEVVEQQVHTVAGEERVGSIVTLAGLVSQEPTVGANSQQVKLRVDDAIILLFLEPYQVVQYGDTLRVSGKVQHPQPFSAEYGRIFPYDNYLAAEGIGYVMYYPSWERIAAGNGYPWMHALYSIKETFQTHLQQVISEPQVSLGKGLLLGIKSGLGDELEAAFRTTGLIHIVVLSGFNVILNSPLN